MSMHYDRIEVQQVGLREDVDGTPTGVERHTVARLKDVTIDDHGDGYSIAGWVTDDEGDDQ